MAHLIKRSRALLPMLGLVLLTALTLLVACTEDDDAGGAITLVDPSGVEVTLDGVPESIVSLSPAATEILFELGAGDAVTAVDDFSNFPEATDGLPKLSTWPEVSIEGVLVHDPELVILTAGAEAVAGQLRDLDIAVLFLDGATTMDGVYDHVRLLGEATGRSDEADTVVSSMRARIEEIEGALADVEAGPRVFYELDPGLFTVGPGSFLDDLLTILKVENIAAASDSPFPVLTAEAIIEANPSVIVLADAQFGETAEAVAERPGWDAVDAVQNDRVIEILEPDIVSRPGPRIGEGLALLARLLYPEVSIP